MQIIVKGKKSDPTRKMSVSERESIKERQQDMASQLADKSSSHIIQDSSTLSKQNERDKEALAIDEDLVAKGKEKDRLQAKAKEHVEFLKENVPPLWLQRAKPGTPEYIKALDAGVRANAADVGKNFAQYQDCRRRLDPENPSAGCIREIIDK